MRRLLWVGVSNWIFNEKLLKKFLAINKSSSRADKNQWILSTTDIEPVSLLWNITVFHFWSCNVSYRKRHQNENCLIAVYQKRATQSKRQLPFSWHFHFNSTKSPSISPSHYHCHHFFSSNFQAYWVRPNRPCPGQSIKFESLPKLRRSHWK